MGRVARIVSFIWKAGGFSERDGILGSKDYPSYRPVFDVEVLSCSWLGFVTGRGESPLIPSTGPVSPYQFQRGPVWGTGGATGRGMEP